MRSVWAGMECAPPQPSASECSFSGGQEPLSDTRASTWMPWRGKKRRDRLRKPIPGEGFRRAAFRRRRAAWPRRSRSGRIPAGVPSLRPSGCRHGSRPRRRFPPARDVDGLPLIASRRKASNPAPALQVGPLSTLAREPASEMARGPPFQSSETALSPAAVWSGDLLRGVLHQVEAQTAWRDQARAARGAH
jgi:hypothetical protein